MLGQPVPESDEEAARGLFQMSLPEVRCSACFHRVPRRKHRMMLRASWRQDVEYLCPDCWLGIVDWAKRFALQQMELPI